MALGKNKFLIVSIGYFTKWVKVEPLATITRKNVLKFIWKNIMYKFGTHKRIILDNHKQFFEEPFKSW